MRSEILRSLICMPSRFHRVQGRLKAGAHVNVEQIAKIVAQHAESEGGVGAAWSGLGAGCPSSAW